MTNVIPPGPGPAGRHHVPGEGRHGLRVGEGKATGTAGFINVQGRLFAPLQGLESNDVLLGGYGYLDVTDGGHTLHPGVDLNSPAGGRGSGCNVDLGLAVVAPLAGVVRACFVWDGVTPGEGTHVWLELLDPLAPAPTWCHADHLDGLVVKVGQRLVPGEPIGTCGQSGGWSCSHLHWELLPAAPQDGWWQWPYGWTAAQVEAAYYSPTWWWQAASAKVQGASQEQVMAILSGTQTEVLQAALWAPQAFNKDAAIAVAWRDDWHRGVWRGRPLGPEELLPEDPQAGKPAGSFQLFEAGCCVWLPGQPASWNG